VQSAGPRRLNDPLNVVKPASDSQRPWFVGGRGEITIKQIVGDANAGGRGSWWPSTSPEAR
jgi:hypothetical protein